MVRAPAATPSASTIDVSCFASSTSSWTTNAFTVQSLQQSGSRSGSRTRARAIAARERRCRDEGREREPDQPPEPRPARPGHRDREQHRCRQQRRRDEPEAADELRPAVPSHPRRREPRRGRRQREDAGGARRALREQQQRGHEERDAGRHLEHGERRRRLRVGADDRVDTAKIGADEGDGEPPRARRPRGRRLLSPRPMPLPRSRLRFSQAPSALDSEPARIARPPATRDGHDDAGARSADTGREPTRGAPVSRPQLTVLVGGGLAVLALAWLISSGAVEAAPSGKSGGRAGVVLELAVLDQPGKPGAVLAEQYARRVEALSHGSIRITVTLLADAVRPHDADGGDRRRRDSRDPLRLGRARADPVVRIRGARRHEPPRAPGAVRAPVRLPGGRRRLRARRRAPARGSRAGLARGSCARARGHGPRLRIPEVALAAR